MQKTTAIILAAGRGKRLDPFTKRKPKCLLVVGIFPILYYQLLSLQKNGITSIIIVVGYKSADIKTYVSHAFPSLTITFVENSRFRNTNTLYSLALAIPYIHPETQILLMNGDVLFASNILYQVLHATYKNVVATRKKTCYKEEVKVFCKNERVLYLRKPFVQKDYAGESIGIYLFSSAFWQKLSRHLRLLQKTHTHEYFEFAIEKVLPQEPMYPFLTNLYAKEIDFPHDLTAARKKFKNNTQQKKILYATGTLYALANSSKEISPFSY